MLRDRRLIPLSRQHQHALALCVLTRRGLPSGEITALAGKIVQTFEIELANHFELEEQVLFPICPPLALIAELIQEHRRLENLVAALRTDPSAELLEEFCALLTAHIRKEERDLFEQVQNILPAGAFDRAGEEIERRAVLACFSYSEKPPSIT